MYLKHRKNIATSEEVAGCKFDDMIACVSLSDEQELGQGMPSGTIRVPLCEKSNAAMSSSRKGKTVTDEAVAKPAGEATAGSAAEGQK